MNDMNDPIPRIGRDDEAAGSGDLVRENVARLKALFPQIVTDGQVDFEVLRELLGGAVEEGEERYGLNWKGKRRARAFALTPSLGTLRPAPEDSVDWGTTQNLMVEGDNLEVLKLLRRSYDSVKFVYIDPPYNTGSDFVYPDNYRSSINNYMAVTGQSAPSGEALTTNREAAGRLHADWLNMIYPRLLAAKEMMAEDGIIAVSCDDSELANLRELMSEVFGEEAFVAQIIWRKRSTPPNDKIIGANHDYITVYRRQVGDGGMNLRERSKDQIERYQNPDNHPKGPWAAGDLMANVKGGRYVESLNFPIVNPNTGEENWPGNRGNWRFSSDTIQRLIAQDEIYFGSDGRGKPKLKRFLSDVKDGVTYPTIWDFVPLNTQGSNEMKELFDESTIFESPKPVGLIQELIRLGAGKDAIIIDFFAGSGSTAVAVMEQNALDGGSRRSIIVQLPEQLSLANTSQTVAATFLEKLNKPTNIAELTKERLRRAGAKIRAEHPDAKVDTGFRVYKLAASNLKPWQPDAEDLEASILDAVDNVLPDRTEEDLLVELLLKTGIDLTVAAEKRSIAGRTVHALGGGALLVCLGDVGADDAEALGQGMADWVEELDPVGTTVYFKDIGLGADGNRAATKANLAAILRQRLDTRLTKIASI